MNKILIFFCVSILAISAKAQKNRYTHADSLKGTYGPARAWWDLKSYDLSVKFNLSDSSISGTNRIYYNAISSNTIMQLDLMPPMQIDSIIHYSMQCKFKRDGNAYIVELPAEQLIGVTNEVLVYFHGKPLVAKMPPWDGGVVWTKDDMGNPWVSIACQGMAAQVWFPNKDHMADEPENVIMHYTVPSDLVAVSNGRLKKIMAHKDGTSTYTWKVVNPINNYCMIPYIGKYSNAHDTIFGVDGMLDIDYWALDQHLLKAKAQFSQCKTMLRCFESWFGKYPFYEDGYKLVEAPFLGMEHQSAIAYGNGFVNGYKGRDLSMSGWGLKWDFIIVHESGHEWFGNSISAKDVADNWIHESFTSYSENLYVEKLFGKKAGAEYVIGTRKSVLNDKPIIMPYNVNAGGSIDIYYKGANMLHTIRQIVNNDSIWRAMFLTMNKQFYHQTVETAQIENFMSDFLHLNLKPIFDQYLRSTKIPVLELSKSKSTLKYRFVSVNKGFTMPVGITVNGNYKLLQVNEQWQEIKEVNDYQVDENYYVVTKPLN